MHLSGDANRAYHVLDLTLAPGVREGGQIISNTEPGERKTLCRGLHGEPFGLLHSQNVAQPRLLTGIPSRCSAGTKTHDNKEKSDNLIFLYYYSILQEWNCVRVQESLVRCHFGKSDSQWVYGVSST